MPTRVILVEESSTRRGLSRIGASGHGPPIGTSRRSLKELKEDGALFHSSILRGVNCQNHGHHRPHVRVAGISNYSRSTADISSSPRLLGYCFMLLTSIVVLFSSVQFYENEGVDMANIFRRRMLQTQDQPTEGIEAIDTEDDFVETFGGLVFKWKLNGALACGSAATLISLLTVLVHFDKWVFPKTWARLFRDGSTMEAKFLGVLVFFWMACLHICTSSFSVGAVQPNVYFATWLGFTSCILNVDIWRVSAGLKGIEACFFTHDRATTKIWAWLFICTLITCFALVDRYVNRNFFVIKIDNGWVPISELEWQKGFSITVSSWGATVVALVGNTYLKVPLKVRLCGKYVLNLQWRFVEGWLAAGMAGLYMWIIFTYTGTAGVINEPGNGYFGIWGTFFFAVSVLGTWIKENQDCLLLKTLETDTDDILPVDDKSKQEQAPESDQQIVDDEDGKSDVSKNDSN